MKTNTLKETNVYWELFKKSPQSTNFQETVVAMNASCSLSRHVEARDDLPRLVDALGLHGAFQATHAVVDHRSDDGNLHGFLSFQSLDFFQYFFAEKKTKMGFVVQQEAQLGNLSS